MKRFFISFLSAVFMAVTPSVFGQNAVVYPERSEIFIGEHIQLKLKFELPKNSVSYSFPEFINDTITKHIEVISALEKTDTLKISDPDFIHLERTYIITSFDTGIQRLPSLPFSYKTLSENPPDTIFSDSLFLKVNLVDVDTTQAIMDIKHPWCIPFQWRDYILHFILGILIIAMIVAVLYYFMRRKKGLPLFPARIVPQLPPDEEALLSLNKIKKEKIWRAGLIKDYYTLLTDTLRKYIERRYDIPAPEFTSAETIAALKDTDIDVVSSSKLEHILRIADMVKFAKGNPVATENENCLELAFDIVLQTKPLSGDEIQATENNEHTDKNNQA